MIHLCAAESRESGSLVYLPGPECARAIAPFRAQTFPDPSEIYVNTPSEKKERKIIHPLARFFTVECRLPFFLYARLDDKVKKGEWDDGMNH